MSTEETTDRGVKMEVMPDGPIRVSGEITLVDNEGAVIFEGDKTALCRCGLSSKKPFCDGTHRKEGWKADA